MKSLLLPLLMAAGILSAATSAQGAAYSQNFDAFANGTTVLGDGTILSSSVSNASIQGGALRLTNDNANTATGESAAFKIPGFTGAANGWTAEFDVTITDAAGENNPADGMSFNWGGIAMDTSLSGNAGGAEHGWTGSVNHVAFQVDTWSNGGGDNGLRIAGYTTGAEVLHAAAAGNILNDGTSVTGHVVVSWNPVDGASMTTTGFLTNVNYTAVDIPGLVASDTNVFAFAARTGGANETLQVDNLVITSTPGVGIPTPNLAISEMVLDNTTYEDEHCQKPGWIELYNGTASAISLDGWSLTDDSGAPGKWMFPNGKVVPPYGYIIVYFGHGTPAPTAPDTRLHASFVPLKTGGYVGLYQGGTLVDSFNPYPAQYEDISYGHLGAAWTLGFLQTPSPGTKNTGAQDAQGPITEEVTWPQDGGLFTTNFSLTLTPPVTPGSVIRYTLDNSPPTSASTEYTAPISVTGNANIRAAVFVPGRLPGPVTSRTFIKLDTTLTNYRSSGQPFQSNLPVIVFDSFGANVDATRSDTYTYSVVLAPDAANGSMSRLTPTAPIDFQGRGMTHLRGETSAGMPQKPYAWEIWDNKNNDKDVSILGMPAEADWVLYAPATDKTILRNFTVYNSMYDLNGQGSAMRTRLVEVFFKQNASTALSYSDYRGVYVLVEKIKVTKDRVDIEKLKACDTAPSVIDGGYLFRKDKVSTDPTITTTNGQVLQVLEPEVVSGNAQWTWLRDHLNAFESSLYGAGFADPVTGWRAYLDEQSWQDNEWWVEIYKQIDGYRLSTYFTKDRGQKIKSAPVWDYNLSGGNGDYLAGWNYRGWYRDAGISQGQSGATDFQYYWRLRQDASYLRRLWDRYWKIRKSVLTTPALMGRIDQAVSALTNGTPAVNITNGTGTWPSSVPSAEVPAARHHARWQQLGRYDWPNAPGYAGRTKWSSTTDAADYASLTGTPYNVTTPPAMSETVHLKSFMTNRLSWIDNANISGTTILRPPVFSQEGGNVAPGYNLTITPYTGTAPAAADYGLSGTLTYPSGPIYYSTDGTDPLGSTVPGTARNFVTDTHAIQISVPSSAAANADSFGVSWLNPDFNVASPPAGITWYTGTNGVGYDDAPTSGGDFNPHIGFKLNTSANPVAGRPTMRGTASPPGNQSCYIRYPFTLTAGDIAGLAALKLYAKCDDGCVAWLNGVKIGEFNPSVSLAWNSGAAAGAVDANAITYVELPALNTAAAIAALRVGVNVLTVQGLNAGVNSNDFLQRYKLDGITASGISSPGTLYTGAIPLNSAATVRARQFDNISGTWTPLSEATFAVGTVPASASNLVVSEIMYNPVDPTVTEAGAGYINANMFEYLEVQNISNSNVDMSGVVFSGAFAYLWPSDNPTTRVLAPGQRAVIVGNLGAFTLRYAPGPSVKIAGVFDGNISNGGEQIVITGTGGVIKDFIYDDAAPWPLEPDTLGYSLVLNHPLSNPNHSLPGSWRSSLEVHGTPGLAPGASGPTGSEAAALADSDGDGISDLVEYATGTLGNNGASQHWPATGRLTAVVPPSLGPEEYLTFSYVRSRSADGFSFEPEVSSALTGWQPLSTLFTFTGQSNNPDGTATLTWRSTAPASTLPPRLFLQVRAGITP